MNLLIILLLALQKHPNSPDSQCKPTDGRPNNSSAPPPDFSMDVYSLRLKRNLEVGQVVAKSSWNSEVWYSLVGTNEVSIDMKSGKLRVRSDVKPETLEPQTFFAVATDSNRKSATATIKVDFAFEVVVSYEPINKGVYEMDVLETFPINTELMDIYKLKIGFIHLPGEGVRLYLEENFNSTFHISQEGVISNLKLFDYDKGIRHYDLNVIIERIKQNPYSLTVYVVRVTINVLDQNDNQPYFTESLSTLQLPTDLTAGESIYKVNAIDPDNLDHLSYSLINGDKSVFSLDPNSGVITLDRQLNQDEKFELTYQVTDSRPPYHKAVSTLLVTGVNPSRGYPVFPYRVGEFRLREDNAGNTLLKSIRAEGSPLEYSIEPSTERPSGTFRVDNQTGDVFVVPVLDREIVPTAGFVLKAVNTDTQLASYVQVFLEVMDIHDNAPRWPYDTYRVNLYRSLVMGSKIFQEAARDRDQNTQLLYTLRGTGSELFTLKTLNNTAVIYLNGVLPSDRTFLYLQLRAYDGVYDHSTSLYIYLYDER